MDRYSQPFRAAIIGTGGIAATHAQALDELGDRVRLVAVVDIDEARAAAFATAHDVDRVYTDAGELFEAEDLDLVHICTPPSSHVPLAAMASRAGVVPLVEKPIALSLEKVDELARVERETGVPILTVFQHRFGPAAQHVRRLFRDGALGRPLVATCETLWYRDDEYFEVPWRGRWEIEGGGPTMGHGIHQFDLLLAILGDWARVSAFAARQARQTDTEDVSVAVVEFAAGTVGTIVNSVLSPRETSRLRIDFERATVEVEHLYGYTDADWTFTPVEDDESLREAWRAGLGSEDVSTHRMQIADILDALEEGRAPDVSLRESRRTLELAAAIYASAFRGAPVSAGEISAGDAFASSMDGGALPWARVKGVQA